MAKSKKTISQDSHIPVNNATQETRKRQFAMTQNDGTKELPSDESSQKKKKLTSTASGSRESSSPSKRHTTNKVATAKLKSDTCNTTAINNEPDTVAGKGEHENGNEDNCGKGGNDKSYPRIEAVRDYLDSLAEFSRNKNIDDDTLDLYLNPITKSSHGLTYKNMKTVFSNDVDNISVGLSAASMEDDPETLVNRALEAVIEIAKRREQRLLKDAEKEATKEQRLLKDAEKEATKEETRKINAQVRLMEAEKELKLIDLRLLENKQKLTESGEQANS
ncbi:hypothetical protein BGZ49_009700 [Haplosporangium sp. Z 27]|nr:hypothetical protein BGZ49_009700 [Haplosporangium sp. Z 27]